MTITGRVVGIIDGSQDKGCILLGLVEVGRAAHLATRAMQHNNRSFARVGEVVGC
jgi:hypothetical protein